MRMVNGKKIYGPLVTLNSTVWLQKSSRKSKGKKLKKTKRHQQQHLLENEFLALRISLSQTKHKMRIIKIQPAVKVSMHIRQNLLLLLLFYLHAQFNHLLIFFFFIEKCRIRNKKRKRTQSIGIDKETRDLGFAF